MPEMMSLPRGNIQFLRSVTDPTQIAGWLAMHGHCKSLAMVGRSNVGKSSLINALFGAGTARTAKVAGRTRAINIFQFEIKGGARYLYDLPGYGHARVSRGLRNQWDQLMDSYFRALDKATTIVSIQDIRHPFEAADHDFYRYLGPFDLPVLLVYNKWDKLKSQRERAQWEQTKRQILQDYHWVQRVFCLSARSGEGVEELADGLARCL